jgi:hypothetical protein
MTTRQPQEPSNGDKPWMSHHNGRVTGTNVPPGQGDAEAGLAADDDGTESAAASMRSAKEVNRPIQDDERPDESGKGVRRDAGEPRGVQPGIADADKIARTGTADEPVRNTPPAGKWNDTSPE